MTQPKFQILANIEEAETLPSAFYRSEFVFEELKEKVFYNSWQYVGDDTLVPLPGHIHPLVLLDDFITEPLV